MKKIYQSILALMTVGFMATTTLSLSSCREEIEEGNLYTFTGETIEDFLRNREEFSSFNYILQRIRYDKIMASYGTYTCFAPVNEAVQEYIDSLYADMSNPELPHNGMTQPGLEGLTDSLCRDIALFHLLYTKVMGVEMVNPQKENSNFTTMLNRYIDMKASAKTGGILINNSAEITFMDNELENGVLHVIDHVIPRSNNTVAGEILNHPEYSIFSKALYLTGLADSLMTTEKPGIRIPKNSNWSKAENIFVASECRMGFTIFAETDDVFKKNHIESLDDLIEYANNVYGGSADSETGWYDYYRDNGIEVSTGTDFESPSNALNMFVRYHLVNYVVPYAKFFHPKNAAAKAQLWEYLETMLPFTLVKLAQVSSRPLMNRWVANSTLTDRLADYASPSIATVLRPGIMVLDAGVNALNGYIHPIDNILVYDNEVPHGVLNERIRFDSSALLGELMTNNYRCIGGDELKAMNGGKVSGSGIGGNGGIRLPSTYCDHIVIYNDENTEVYYLPGQDVGWWDYEGDEMMFNGVYDFAFRLPPVPKGTYEIRIGFSANGNRGMMQYYLGRTSDRTKMKTLDIPLDMRNSAVDNTDGSPDPNYGWCDYTKTDDMGVATDAIMHNLGWMRSVMCTENNGANLRKDRSVFRRIITKTTLEQGEYWIRAKSMLPDKKNAEFMFDYVELCPENVFNNSQYAEDMW